MIRLHVDFHSGETNRLSGDDMPLFLFVKPRYTFDGHVI